MTTQEKCRKILLRLCCFLGIIHWNYNNGTQRYEQALKPGLHPRIYGKTILKCIIIATYCGQLYVIINSQNMNASNNLDRLLAIAFVEFSAYTLRQMCRLVLQHEKIFMRILNALQSIQEQMLRVLHTDMFERTSSRQFVILHIRCLLSLVIYLLIILPILLVAILTFHGVCGIYLILIYELLFYALQMFQLKVHAFYANANHVLSSSSSSSSSKLKASHLHKLLQASWNLAQLQQKVSGASSTYLMCIFSKIIPSVMDMFFAVRCILTDRILKTSEKLVIVMYTIPVAVLVLFDLIAVAYLNELVLREMKQFADGICFLLAKRNFGPNQNKLLEREAQNLLLRHCFNMPELNANGYFKIDRAFAFEFGILLSIKTIELSQFYLVEWKYGFSTPSYGACTSIYYLNFFHIFK